MAKSTAQSTWGSKLYATWIVLGISLLVNAILISFITYANSKHADNMLISHALQNVCVRDYNWLMTSGSTGSEDSKVLYSEGLCRRDVATGADINFKVVNGHLVVQP